MYAGVPIIIPVDVRNVPALSCVVAFAIPKSAIFTRPSALTSTFSGFRSRWTIPAASAATSPASTLSSTPLICGRFNCPTNGRSEPRSRYSIARYGVPSCSKYS